MKRTWLALTIGALLSVLASSAAAQTDDDLAREHFRAGRAYFERAEYDDAAREFEESYSLSHRPELLHNISRAYELDGRLPEAIEAIDRWLALPEASADPATLSSAQSRRGRLVAELERQEREAVEQAAAAADPPMSSVRLAGVVTLGGSGALLASAVVTGVLAMKRHDDLEAACPGGVCSPDRADDIQRGERLATSSTTLSIAAGAAAVTGLLLYLLGADEESPEGGTQVEVSAGPGEVRGGLRVRF